MDKKYIEDSKRKKLAREIAGEAMILLENKDGMLPLSKGQQVALIGQTQLAMVIGGGGSGASSSKDVLQLPEELEKAGLCLEPEMKQFYDEVEVKQREERIWQQKKRGEVNFAGLVASGMIYEIFAKYNVPAVEPVPVENIWEKASGNTQTAICILGRSSGGEECDRRVEGDYYLIPSEQELIRMTCESFSNVILVINVNGLVDLAWVSQYPQIKAILFVGPCGEQAAGALSDILTGVLSPSGKLAQTIAFSYEDYPTAKHISYNKDKLEEILTYESYGLSAEENGSCGYAISPVTIYEEDIYVGYRYFDSFKKEVLYPFGHGLSYGKFSYEAKEVHLENGKCKVFVEVTNQSLYYAGKEVIQLYVHAPFGALPKVYQELKVIGKTDTLAPGEAQRMELEFDLCELASFSEKTSAYVIESGDYQILVGNCSRDTKMAAILQVMDTIQTKSNLSDIGIKEVNRGKIEFLTLEKPAVRNQDGVEKKRCFIVTEKDVVISVPEVTTYDFSKQMKQSNLSDVVNGNVTMEEFVNQMTAEELAVCCCGYGSGLPFSGIGQQAPLTIQYEDGTDIGYNSHRSANPGYCNPAIERYRIHSTWYKDGPASVGKVAWPTGMALACTFNPKLAYEFGSACGCEAELLEVDSWLAPGLNLIRNPIEGRAFEYFSEDPYLCGLYGVQVTKGAMENNHITTCPKHFAINEQETYRRGSKKKNIDAVDSILSARAARELYLKPFEMVLTQTNPRTVMTSFNKINGTFAAGNEVLCTEILRKEWGYNGVVVTDWGDLDIVVDGADAVEAGNDVVMPGGPPVIQEILDGYRSGRLSLERMKEAVVHLMHYVGESKSQNRKE